MFNPGPFVRIAAPADEPAIFDALEALYADNDVAGGYSPDAVKRRIHQGVSLGGETGGIVGVIDAPDHIAATVGIFPNVPWYSDDPMLVEQWLFVRTEYRTHGLHWRLVEFARQYRREMQAEIGKPLKLITSVSSNRRLPAKMRLWSKFGRLVGAIYAVED